MLSTASGIRKALALAKRGEPIGTSDTLIAAHALSRGVTLVTDNTKHFQRVSLSRRPARKQRLQLSPAGSAESG